MNLVKFRGSDGFSFPIGGKCGNIRLQAAQECENPMKMKQKTAISAARCRVWCRRLLAAPLLMSCAWADPAVSGINGKLGASYGRFDVTMDDVTSVDGSIAWPLAEAWGLQLDGMYAHGMPASFGFANSQAADYGGVGGHVFWRDSAVAMLGLEGAWVFNNASETNAWQIGLEGEYYLRWLTIGMQAGYSEVEDDSLRAGDHGWYARLEAGCYPVEDLLLNAVVETRYDDFRYGLEVEYETPVAGLALFASAMRGEHGNDAVFGGLRYYFGGDSGLKNRHRRSDPPSRLSGLFAGVQSFHADQLNRRSAAAARTTSLASGSSMSTSNIAGSGTLVSSGSLGSGGSTLTLSGPSGTYNPTSSVVSSGALGGSGAVSGDTSPLTVTTVPSVDLGGSLTGLVTIGPGSVPTSGSGSSNDLTGGSLLTLEPLPPGGSDYILIGGSDLTLNGQFDTVDWWTSQFLEQKWDRLGTWDIPITLIPIGASAAP